MIAESSVAERARRDLQDYRRFLRVEAPVLKQRPGLVLQQAANQPDRTRPAIDAKARLADRQERAWLRWVDNPLNDSVCLLTLTEHAGRISRIAFSPAGDLFVTASSEGTLALWETATGVDIARLEGHRGIVRACAFSPDGRRVVSAAADCTLRIWDVATRQGVNILRGHTSEVTGCGFSPDGLRAVSSSRDGTVRIWDAASGGELSMLIGHRHVVESCAWSPDGARIVSGSRGELMIWDAATGAALATLEGHSYLVTDCAFSPDVSRLASASLDGTVKLWDAATGRLVSTLEGHTDAVWACAFSPDGRLLLSASSDGTLRIWDAVSGARQFVLGAHGNPVTSCAFAPDGETFASGGFSELKLWELPQRSDLRLLADRGVDKVAFSRDGHWIALTGDGPAKIRSGETGEEVTTLEGHEKWIEACAFAPDGHRVATGSSDETLKIWKLPRGEEIGTFIGHSGKVRKVAFSPDGTRMLSDAEDELFSRTRGPNLWDPATSTLIANLNGFKLGDFDQMFAPDGTRLLSGSRTGLRLIDSVTGKDAGAAAQHEERVNDYEFAADGTRIVSAGGKMVRISGANGGELFVLAGHHAEVNYCGFSGDGSRAFSRDADGVLKVWDASGGGEIATFADQGGAYLGWGATADASRVVAPFDQKLTLWKIERDGSAAILNEQPARASWSLSPGREWVAFHTDDEWLAIWETASGREIARYPIGSFGCPLAWGPDGTSLAIKDDSGFRLLRLENAVRSARPVGAWRSREGPLKAGCPFCSTWFDLPADALGAERSCAACGRLLRLLPVAVDGDWRRVAAAWRMPVVTAWRDGERGTITCGCPLCQAPIELNGSNLGQDMNCPQCRESFHVDEMVTPGWPAPKVDAAEELKRQQDARFLALLGQVAAMEQTGQLAAMEEKLGYKPAARRSNPTTLESLMNLTQGGSSRSGQAPARRPKKKPWWKFW